MKRRLYFLCGVLAVGMAGLGAVLPLLPTVPFLLVAAFFFARSNPALERKILDHPHWGPQVRNWTERRAIARPAKIMAIGAMAIGILTTWLTLGYPWYLVSIAILVTAGTWIATRNE